MLSRLSIAAVLMLSSAGALPAQNAVVPAPVLLDTTGMFRDKYARVGTDLFIGGQPTERALREMKAAGVTVVVNLRMPEEMARVGFDEKALVESLGMKYVHIPMRGSAEAPYAPVAITKFADAVKTANGKVLLHCTVAWRASHLYGAYLIQEKGVPESMALDHARAINLMDEHRMSADGKQPIEEFLGKKLSGIRAR
jgi:protein tyrosine phosphatase (PTP) superfamily phosphohydrolase (DUF442 family)